MIIFKFNIKKTTIKFKVNNALFSIKNIHLLSKNKHFNLSFIIFGKLQKYHERRLWTSIKNLLVIQNKKCTFIRVESRLLNFENSLIASCRQRIAFFFHAFLIFFFKSFELIIKILNFYYKTPNYTIMIAHKNTYKW